MEWYINFFFRLLNFSAIIGITWYLFVRYLAPTFRAEMSNEHKQHICHQQKQQLLEQHITVLMQQTQRERILYEAIKDRIVMWQAIVEDKGKQVQQQQEHTIQALLDRFLKQQYNHANLVARSKEANAVIVSVVEGIKKKYNNITTKEQFTTFIIESIITEKKE